MTTNGVIGLAWSLCLLALLVLVPSAQAISPIPRGIGPSAAFSLAVEDPTPPPVLTDTDPDSPANYNSPSVKGTAEAGSTVHLHTSSASSGYAVATGAAEDFSWRG